MYTETLMASDLVEVVMTLEGSQIKTVWHQGEAKFFPYTIDVGLLRRMGAAARSALKRLVTATRQNDAREMDRALLDVARAGRDLYDALFTSDGAGQAEADDVVHWLTGRADIRITFSVDPRIHIPFGLIFDGELGTGNSDYTNPDEYWCSKYRVATVYSRLTPSGLDSTPDARQFRLLLALNESVITDVLGAVTPEEQEAWTQMTGAPSQIVRNSQDLINTWKNNNSEIGILYFLCHANGTRLSFSDDDELGMDQIHLKLKNNRSFNRPPCLIVLNGCSTAVGSEDGGFLEAAGSSGFCGFVGTETAVPDVFAFRFGHELIARLLQNGETVADTLAHLRRAHWPLSLVYGLYAYPLLQVNVLKRSFTAPCINYSDGPLGTREI